MTIQELDELIFEAECRISTGVAPGWVSTGLQRHRQEREREVTRQAEEARVQQEAARRASTVHAIAPRPSILRGFVRDLIAHTADLLLRFNVSFEFDGRRPRANLEIRTVYSDFVMTEKAYVITLHEIAHVVEVAADSFQQRHEFGASWIASPSAEVAAWRWAVANCWRGIWTPEMQATLAESVRTYRSGATLEEKEAIDDLIRESAGKVIPAPDTMEARVRRMRQIEREEIVRSIEIDQRYRAAMARHR